MAEQGPQGGGNFGADGRFQGGAHGLSIITRNAAGKADDFDRAGASFRRRRKRATDPTSQSTVPTSAKSVVEAATILLLVFSVIFGLVSCAPTPLAASFQQARECRELVYLQERPHYLAINHRRSSFCASTLLLLRSSRLASVEGLYLQERTHLGLHDHLHEFLHERLHERLQERLQELLHERLRDPPAAHQLATAPPIVSNRLSARPDRTDSSSLSAHLRPATPPACRPDYPSRLAWTRPLLCHAAQRLHAGKPCHAGSHGTLQKYHLEKNSKKKSPILRCNNAFEEPGGYVRTSAPRMAPALFRSFGTSSGPSSRAPSRTPSGASSAQQQTAPLARAGLKTAINVIHA